MGLEISKQKTLKESVTHVHCTYVHMDKLTRRFKSCSLYPGLRIPSRYFKSWAVWKNEKDSVLAKSKTSLQGATLKSCSNNINAVKRPSVEV